MAITRVRIAPEHDASWTGVHREISLSKAGYANTTFPDNGNSTYYFVTQRQVSEETLDQIRVMPGVKILDCQA